MGYWYIMRKSDQRVLDCRPGHHDWQAPLMAVIVNHGGTTDDYEIGAADFEVEVWKDPAQVTAEKWENIRRKRDRMMDDSDWKLLRWLEEKFDLEIPAELRAYRESLRDLPQTYADPDKVVWPTEG